MRNTTSIFAITAIAAITACVPPDDEPGEEREVLSETTQGLTTTSITTTRGVYLSANVLADWGNNKQISAALVTGHTLRVRYCAEHFPAGSQQLSNLNAALGAYNGVPGVAINLVDVAEEPGTT